MSSSESPNDNPEPSRSRLPLLMTGGAVVLVAAFLGGRLLAPLVRGDRPTPAPAAAAKPETPPPVAAPVSPAPEPAPAEAPREAKARVRKKAEPPAPAAGAPAATPTTGELHISSDVPGAMVFLDRVYLGAAPVTASNVAPGSHHLNASADGYDGYAETIQVAAGPADVMVRFKEIRLSETLSVVHKHGIGSCEGRLVADPQGVRYETANKDDAFSLKFGEIENFDVEYLKKNLRIKRRGGKTWNFTTKTENADPLFVFHRNVDKVRQQVAGGKGK
jgi:hypothetical protein